MVHFDGVPAHHMWILKRHLATTAGISWRLFWQAHASESTYTAFSRHGMMAEQTELLQVEALEPYVPHVMDVQASSGQAAALLPPKKIQRTPSLHANGEHAADGDSASMTPAGESVAALNGALSGKDSSACSADSDCNPWPDSLFLLGSTTATVRLLYIQISVPSAQKELYMSILEARALFSSDFTSTINFCALCKAAGGLIVARMSHGPIPIAILGHSLSIQESLACARHHTVQAQSYSAEIASSCPGSGNGGQRFHQQRKDQQWNYQSCRHPQLGQQCRGGRRGCLICF